MIHGMADVAAAEPYLLKAEESLASAESDYINGRYNSCANRCYYACFQSAIAALILASIRPSSGQWGHEYVISQFVGVLVNRRKRFPATLRTVLDQNIRLRQRADYEPDPITRTEAERALRRSREFVQSVLESGGIRS
jgi:uncharacterized protein (UPF0332 family)